MRLLPCFKCGKELEPVFPDIEANQPHKGTVFQSYGKYGSTVLDRMDSRFFLEITICDTCLRIYNERVLSGRRHDAGVTFTYQDWDGEPIPW